MDDGISITYLARAESFDETASSGHFNPHDTIYFARRELAIILNVYGRMVTCGVWKDYAITHQKKRAAFAVFRRAAEQATYTIVKEPALAQKQGTWRIEGMVGQTLKRGKDLSQLLKYFDRLLLKAV